MIPRGPCGSLPHYLRPGLDVVFIGYNPGLVSHREGRYYAHPGNAFWRHLGASGLVPRPVGPTNDASLMDEAGIGFADLCCRPTLRASELTAAEIAEGARRLRAELLANQPRFAVFSGKGVYNHFARAALALAPTALAHRAYGEQPERVGATRPWVLPSSSGLASRWHAERLRLLQTLASAARDTSQ